MRCEQTQAALENFPQDLSSLGLRQRGGKKGSSSSTVVEEKMQQKSAAPADAYKYTVGVGDSEFGRAQAWHAGRAAQALEQATVSDSLQDRSCG